jgi:hypothetical protein
MDITLVYGDQWYEGVAPRICLKPEDYEPGKYDFSVCAGTHVLVLDQLLGAAEHDDRVRPPTYGKFYDLLTELAAADCWVTIRWPTQVDWLNRDLGDYAFELINGGISPCASTCGRAGGITRSTKNIRSAGPPGICIAPIRTAI